MSRIDHVENNNAGRRDLVKWDRSGESNRLLRRAFGPSLMAQWLGIAGLIVGAFAHLLRNECNRPRKATRRRRRRAPQRLDLRPFAGVLGRVAGQVCGGRRPAGHGPRQADPAVEGGPGHDLAPAAAPAPAAQGQLAPPPRARHPPGRQRLEHRNAQRPAGVGQERRGFPEDRLPPLRPGLVPHPPPPGVAPLAGRPRSGSGPKHGQSANPQHFLRAGWRLSDPRQHPLRDQHGPLPSRRSPFVTQRDGRVQREPARLSGEVGRRSRRPAVTRRADKRSPYSPSSFVCFNKCGLSGAADKFALLCDRRHLSRQT